MGANRINKIDEIQNNTTTNITLSPSADIIANSPNITANKVLFVDTSKELKTSAIDQSNITKNSLNETTDPAASNDDSQDYSVGSFWYNKTYGKLFVCTDASTAAAAWNLVREVIIDSKVNIDALSRQAGNLYYASDEQKYYGDDGLSLISLGGGGAVIDTLANIQAAGRVQGQLYLASDTLDFLGDDGTNLQSLSIIKDTRANLDSLTRLAGRIVFDTTNNIFLGDDGTSLVNLGGSIGSIDTYYAENFEINDVASLTSGNNATYLNGGTLQGSLANETGTPIKDDRSISYSQALGSLNDWFNIETITLDEQQKDKTNTFVFYANYSGNTGDIEAVVWDGSTKIATVDIEAATIAKRYELKPFVASSVTNLSIGFQVKVENNGAELIFDSVELNTNPFQFTSLTDIQSLRMDGHAGFGATNTALPYFTNINEEINSGSIFSYVNNSTDGFILTANRRCRVVASYNDGGNATTSYFSTQSAIVKNGTEPTTIPESITNKDEIVAISGGQDNSPSAYAYYQQVTGSTILEAGDTLWIQSENNSKISDRTNVSIVAEAEVESILSASNKELEFAKFEGIAGLGSTNTQIYHFTTEQISDYGNLISISNSTVNGLEITAVRDCVVNISFSDPQGIGRYMGFSLNSTELNTSIASLTNTADRYNHIFNGTGNDGFRNVSDEIKMSAGDVLRPHGGTLATAGANAVLTIAAKSMDRNIISPLIKPCRIYDQKADGVNGGSGAVNTWTARDLNQIDGNTSFVSLSANQFTLASGEYVIHATAPFKGSDSASLRLYNVTDAGLESNILSTNTGQGGSVNIITVPLKGTFTIDSPKTFELQYLINQTVGTDDLGRARLGTVSEVEIYADILLQKVR